MTFPSLREEHRIGKYDIVENINTARIDVAEVVNDVETVKIRKIDAIKVADGIDKELALQKAYLIEQSQQRINGFLKLIKEAYSRIDEMKKLIASKQAEIDSILEFKQMDQNIREEEIGSLRLLANEQRERHHNQISKIQKRHHTNVACIKEIMENVISEAESNACKKILNAADSTIFRHVKTNNILKERIRRVYENYLMLKKITKKLEMRHFEMLESMVECNLNFEYDSRNNDSDNSNLEASLISKMKALDILKPKPSRVIEMTLEDVFHKELKKQIESDQLIVTGSKVEFMNSIEMGPQAFYGPTVKQIAINSAD